MATWSSSAMLTILWWAFSTGLMLSGFCAIFGIVWQVRLGVTFGQDKADRVWTVRRSKPKAAWRVDLPNVRYNSPESVAAVYDRAMNRISLRIRRAKRGVDQHASRGSIRLQQRCGSVRAAASLNVFFAENRNVAGDYFATMGIPILRGRNFLPEEMNGKEKAVIINQTMARSLWKGKIPSDTGFAALATRMNGLPWWESVATCIKRDSTSPQNRNYLLRCAPWTNR